MDKVDSFEYKGSALTVTTEWIFHRGTFTKQISPLNVGSIDTGTDVITLNGHPYNNGDLVRFSAINGDIPAAINRDLRYKISDKATNTFKIKDEAGVSYINFTDVGSGTIIVWKADSGFDDPVQGLPTFCPEVETTFSNIAYVEFKLPADVSDATAQPDWEDFRIIGTGRRLMDYDNAGAEQGVVSNDDELLSNIALEIADNAIVNYNVKPERFDWPSWYALRQASNEQIWQRAQDRPDDTPLDQAEVGFTGRYYTGMTFTDLVITRLDTSINFPNTTAPPTAGLPNHPFCVRWNGRIKAKFSELTTFRLYHDDSGKFWINGNLLIDSASYGTSTANFMLEADEIYEVTLELIQGDAVGEHPWAMIFEWTSASLPYEPVPAAPIAVTDGPVRRYECHMAFPTPTEASEVHERLMERCPGWDWTDDNGLIVFLDPDRPVSFTFAFDMVDDDSLANFVKQTFIKKRRPLNERKNFVLFKYRDVQFTGFPSGYIQIDREALRDLAGGVPTNDPASDLGVATKSLAERIGEMQLVLKSDPKYVANISGARPSSKIRKNDILQISYYDIDGNYVVDETFLVTLHAWRSPAGQNDFNLVPIPMPFYADEVYTPPVLLYAIDAGRPAGGTVGGWSQDTFNSGGSTSSTADTINTATADRPAPMAVYQTRRYGSFSYTVTGLEADAPHIIRLHFAEIVATTNGARIFDVLIQGELVLDNLDIHAKVGHDVSFVREFNVSSDGSGEIAITFTAGTSDPQLNGLEVYGF